MNKIIFSCFIIVTFSCSKNDEPIVQPQVINNEIIPTEFTILNDPNQVINNLQVGNRLAFEVKIKNFDTNPNVVYVLKPILGNATKHQLKGTDYNLQTIEANDAFVNKDSIIIKNSNSKAYIQILRPGCFQHEYTLQKMELNKKINPEAKQNVLFNAVKININAPPIFLPSDNWMRYFIFSIDDGEMLNDNYLTSVPTKFHSFKTLYEGIQKSGPFTAHQEFTFKDALHDFDNFPPVYTFIINEIKITQNLPGGEINIIKYSNLNF